MVQNITIRLSVVFLVIIFAFGLSLAPSHAHNGVDHDSEAEETMEMEKMRQMVVLLTTLVDLLTKKAEMSGAAPASHHEDASEHESEELAVWVEIHSNITHAHVQEVGKKEVSFLLEDLEYTQEDEIIEEIRALTGLSVHDIEEVIVFPSGEVDEHGDSVEEHDEHADEDVSGIHIMADGKIMWGNGTEVLGATLVAGGKIKLKDGDIITPAFDLR